MKIQGEPKPLGKARFEPIRTVRYLDELDVFEVEFDSGEIFRIKQTDVRSANGLTGRAEVDSVWIESEQRAGFLVRYRNGEWADCAWDFVREISPAKS